jgi:hypothetical protein
MLPTRTQLNTIIDAQLVALGLSSSAVAEWKLWRDAMVTVLLVCLGALEIIRVSIEKTVSSQHVGTLWWYQSICLQFQLGHHLMVDNGVVKYAVDAPAARIVKYAAVIETTEKIVLVKVAKEVGGNPVKLSAAELASFATYIDARRMPGAFVNVSSLDADVLYYYIQVKPQGGYDTALLLTTINERLNRYKTSFKFNSIVYLSHVIEIIEGTDGVNGVNVQIATITPAGSVLVNDLMVLPYVELNAGYFSIDPSSTIIFI